MVGASGTTTMIDILQSGICFSPPFPKPEKWLPCSFYQTESDFQSEVFEEMHRFEWSDFTAVVHHHELAAAAHTRFKRNRNCQHDFGNSENITLLMTKGLKLAEGTFVYTAETGRRIFYFTNGTLRGFPNYDTYIAMGGGSKGSTQLTHRQFRNTPQGEDLPPIAGRRLREKHGKEFYFSV